jgi:hypothetical protein
MMLVLGSSCCVCGSRDARALVEVVLVGGSRATLCGSHALMHRRSREQARSVSALRELFHDRRGRHERRGEADELGAALTAAFNGDRRENSRRHGG